MNAYYYCFHLSIYTYVTFIHFIQNDYHSVIKPFQIYSQSYGITNSEKKTVFYSLEIKGKKSIARTFMDALWEIEDKWKLSTQQAFLLLVSACFAVIGVCMAMTVLRKKAQRKQQQQQQQQQLVVMGQEETTVAALGHKWTLEPSCGWGSIKRALVGSVRWSKASKWGEVRRGGSWRESSTPTGPLLEKRIGVDVGWHSHNSESPVWQRPILMGEKCELPRFSGLILYDERGQPLCDSHQETRFQEKPAPVARTTLRDLL